MHHKDSLKKKEPEVLLISIFIGLQGASGVTHGVQCIAIIDQGNCLALPSLQRHVKPDIVGATRTGNEDIALKSNKKTAWNKYTRQNVDRTVTTCRPPQMLFHVMSIE